MLVVDIFQIFNTQKWFEGNLMYDLAWKKALFMMLWPFTIVKCPFRKCIWIYHHNLMSKWWSETKTIAFYLIRTKPLSADASALPENNCEIRWVSPEMSFSWHVLSCTKDLPEDIWHEKKKKTFSFWSKPSGTGPVTGMPSGLFKSGKVSETQMFISIRLCGLIMH